MYPALLRVIATIAFLLFSISCNESEVTAPYKDQRTYASTTGGADATGSANSGTGTSAGDQDKDLGAAALAILQAKCAGCHANGAASGGFSIVTDVDAMIASNKYVIKGNPEGSAIYKRIAIAKSMPPAGPLPDGDADTIKQWIQGL